MNRRPKRRTWTTSFTPMIFCGVKTMSEELKPCPFCGGSNLRSSGDDKWVGYECLDCGCIGPNQYDSRRDWNTRTALSQAAVGATVRACAEAILHDHTKPDDNRLWGDERPYICEESAYRTILALEPDAQQALDKLLGEKDAEIARLREALGWYGEQARLARLIHSGGNVGRHNLADDGGKRARAALEGRDDDR